MTVQHENAWSKHVGWTVQMKTPFRFKAFKLF